MKRGKILVGISVLTILFAFQLVTLIFSTDDNSYKGVKKCKMCHQSAKRGKQYQQWNESKHSKAYATLATERAKEVAVKAGVTGDPQKEDKCLSCHTTGHNVPAAQREASLTLEEGVSCEACHGAGSAYFKLNTMKKLAAGEIEPASVGLVTPTKELCVKCHNEGSPTYKGFDFDKRYAEIIHTAATAQ